MKISNVLISNEKIEDLLFRGDISLKRIINKPLQRFKTSDVNNFTSDVGLKMRRVINRPLRFILKCATNGNIHVECYPKLEKGAPYIFASTHSFVEEISAILSTIDRSAYSLMGTTQQLEHNPKIYANWLSGLIYVDRNNEKSRKSSIPKMERVLESGSSILIFPEGGWNNTENQLVQNLFSGVYNLSKNTNIPVVPIASFNECGSKDIYISVGNPLNLMDMDKKSALILLRDALATMKYYEIEKHTPIVKRSELGNDPRMDYMEERKREYQNVKWSKDVWDEELTIYDDKNHPTAKKVRQSFDKVNITKENASIFAPILVRAEEDRKYDFNSYMHKNWKVKVK